MRDVPLRFCDDDHEFVGLGQLAEYLRVNADGNDFDRRAEMFLAAMFQAHSGHVGGLKAAQMELTNAIRVLEYFNSVLKKVVNGERHPERKP